MTDQPMQAMLTLEAGPEADLEDLEGLTRQLRTELLELDVDAVDLVRAGEMPAKAKAGDPITWGQLLLTFVSGGGLAAFIGLLQAWLIRQGQSSVTVKIGDDELTVTGNPTEQQREAIEVWLRRQRRY
jgi:hypothetical protein